mgnify:CR=1 FL=1
MDYACTVKPLIDGSWLARSVGSDVGPVELQGSDRETALRLLRNEIRFRLEWCPCTAVAEDYVQLLVKDVPDAPWRGTVF